MKCKRILGKGANQVRIMQDNTLRYRYFIGTEGMDYCEFSLYCEIGENYKPVIDFILNEFSIIIKNEMEALEGYPWFADKLLSIQGKIIN